MNKIFSILTFSLLMLPISSLFSYENKTQDVFVPISKYIERGNAENLSAWFAENLELNILGNVTSTSRSQARQIVKNFFVNYSPRSFKIVHRSNSYPMKYAIGLLDGGGESFRVTIFVKISPDGNSIQQFKIEKE